MKHRVLILVLLFFAIFWFWSLQQKSSIESQKVPQGVIKYKLIELETNNILIEQTLHIIEIYHEKGRAVGIFQKYFEDRFFKLFDNFIIRINNYGYKNKKSVKGFGMMLERLNTDDFSWEWYDQQNENMFEKLQGSGHLKVEYKQRDNYWEISKITFIGDHIFRAKKKKALPLIGTDKENWHCIIRDGSYINW